jgi:hypothetical protein
MIGGAISVAALLGSAYLLNKMNNLSSEMEQQDLRLKKAFELKAK